MTQACKGLAIGAVSSLLVGAACGGKHVECGPGTTQVDNQCVPATLPPDPLLGGWTKLNDVSGRMCEFFGNGEWSNTCFLTDGFASKWERIYENRYYVGASYRGCDIETTFSAQDKAVTMTMFCGSTAPETVQLVKVR
jgi:hypothetical protein